MQNILVSLVALLYVSFPLQCKIFLCLLLPYCKFHFPLQCKIYLCHLLPC
jgi:hypothetical protein